MGSTFVQPYTGPQFIDLSEVALFLVDMAPGARRGRQREKPGMEGVVLELASSVPALGKKASISPDVYADFLNAHGMILKIRALRSTVDKAAEALVESEAYYEDLREMAITLITMAVRTSARRKDESIQAGFERTLTYNAQAAMKAVKTRRKNAEARAAAKSESASESESKPEGKSEG